MSYEVDRLNEEARAWDRIAFLHGLAAICFAISAFGGFYQSCQDTTKTSIQQDKDDHRTQP